MFDYFYAQIEISIWNSSSVNHCYVVPVPQSLNSVLLSKLKARGVKKLVPMP